MDLDEATVYTNENKHGSTLTPLYAILQAKDHEPEMRHPQEALIDQCKWPPGPFVEPFQLTYVNVYLCNLQLLKSCH